MWDHLLYFSLKFSTSKHNKVTLAIFFYRFVFLESCNSDGIIRRYSRHTINLTCVPQTVSYFNSMSQEHAHQLPVGKKSVGMTAE